MIKVLSETKPETPKIPKPEKPKTPKTPKPKPEIRVKKKKLKKITQNFDELRHKFSKKEIDRYRKTFHVYKNKKYLSKWEIKKTSKSFNKLKKVWDLKNSWYWQRWLLRPW